MGFVRWVVDRKLKAPVADATLNSGINDVVGNNTDAAVTTVGTTKSLMAYIKGILNTLAITDKTTAGTIVQDGATGTPNVVAATTSASANTFGAWAEIDAAVAADVWISHVTVVMPTNSGDLLNYCVEIGTGAGGAEVAKIRLSSRGMRGYDGSAAHFFVNHIYSLPIPIKVASGVRIAARVSQGLGEADAYSIGVSYYLGL